MQHRILFDNSVRARCPIAATTRNSRIGLYRHRVDGSVEALTSAPAQDAHVVLVQLAEQPRHDFWADGRHSVVPRAPSGTVSILDLSRWSEARFDAKVDSLMVHLPQAALEDIAEATSSGPVASLVVPEGWNAEDPVARHITPLLAEALETSGEATQPYVDHLVLAMATHVATTYGGMRPRVVQVGGVAPWQLKKAQEMLSADLSGRTSLQEVADSCGLSASYFARAFKVSAGTTPHAWLQARRVDHAMALLRSPLLTLSEIALQSGFADQSHFTRVFAQSVGLTPGAWRRLRL
jgi:AraC family transcriptional regulator